MGCAMHRPDSLAELLRDDSVEVERAALSIARDGRRFVDEKASLEALDALAAPLDAIGERVHDATEAARALAAHLHGVCGFRGDDSDYYDPRNSYLDVVLERRIGIPITLSIVYMAVARRVRIPIEGISFPGRFLVRVGGPNGVYQDPFGGGAILDDGALVKLGAAFGGGQALDSRQLAPVGVRAIATRMLVNLENAHTQRNDHASALIVSSRLVELTADPSRRRDRGTHALAIGAFATAIDDFETYLRVRPKSADRARIEVLLARARSQAGSRAN